MGDGNIYILPFLHSSSLPSSLSRLLLSVRLPFVLVMAVLFVFFQSLSWIFFDLSFLCLFCKSNRFFLSPIFCLVFHVILPRCPAYSYFPCPWFSFFPVSYAYFKIFTWFWTTNDFFSSLAKFYVDFCNIKVLREVSVELVRVKIYTVELPFPVRED